MTEVFNQLDKFGWLLIDVAWKSTLLLLLVYGLERLFLRRRAIVADVLWSAALVMLIALPLCCLKLPRFTVPIATDFVRRSSEPTIEASNDIHSIAATGGYLPLYADRDALAAPPTVEAFDEPIVAKTAAPSTWSLADALPLIAMIYLLGVVVMFARVASGLLSIVRLRRAAEPVADESWAVPFHHHKRRLGIRRVVALCHLPQVSVPLTMGWTRPLIVLPSSALRQKDRRTTEVVILHELTHIARSDYLVHVISKIVQCLYWYNPLMWIASRRLNQVREAVCDGYCISFLEDRDGYVKVLLDFARSLTCKQHPALGLAMTRVSRLESRVMGMTPVDRYSLGTTTRVASLLSGLAITIAIGVTAIAQSRKDDTSALSEGQTPAIKEIVEGLQKREQAIQGLRAMGNWESSSNFVAPRGEPPASGLIADDAISTNRKGTIEWEVLRNGASRVEADYLKTNHRFDEKEVAKEEAFISTFDGSNGQIRYTQRSEAGLVTLHDREISRPVLSPFDFTTDHLGQPISVLIPPESSKIVATEEWEQRPVVVVEVPPVTVRDDYIYRRRFWIDRERNHLVVRRQSYVQRGEAQPWGLHYQMDARQHEEISPGIWLPKTVDSWNYHVTKAGRGHLVSRERFEIAKWQVVKGPDRAEPKLEPDTNDQSAVRRVSAVISQKENDADNQSAETATVEPAPEGFQHMTIRTVDSEGKAVPDTRIYVAIWPSERYGKSKREYFTDASGQVRALVPDPPRLFRVWAQKPGYVPLFAQWWPEYQDDGHIIPEEFTFSLPHGTRIGGTIKNEDGQPIEGAVVEVMLESRVNELRPIPSIYLSEAPSPGNNPCITDAEGRWSITNVPEGDDVRVRVKLTHPDYISETQWGSLQEEQSVAMTSFRDQSAVIVMHRGIVLTGTVTDPEGRPVPDAVVIWGDDPYLQQGSQEVRTDANGVYRLSPLPTGPTNVTVVAAGWSPQSGIVDIQPENATADFELEEGNVLLIRFIDDAGNPIPDVAVGIRGWRGSEALYNHHHPNVLDTGIPVSSDSQGKFQWRWAPADEVKYSFYAKGFRGERSLTADGTEHLVTLRPSPDR